MRHGEGTTSFRPILLFPLLAVFLAFFAVWKQSQKPKSEYLPSVLAHPGDFPERTWTPEERAAQKHLKPKIRQQPIPPALANLGLRPDWEDLSCFQKTITRETFLNRLTQIYTKNGGFEKWITVGNDHALIKHSGGEFKLQFSSSAQTPPGAIWNWKSKVILPHKKEAPLLGYHIALDPGHIGGSFAAIEERHLKYGNHPAIEEGTMTLLTAQHLKPLLEAQGARVTLIRETNEPITPTRPSDYRTGRSQRVAEKLFYRTAEIRARAELINHTIQPDFVICLHYNATGSPVPTPGQDFHILLNGAYHESELKHEDERFQMLQRLLSGTICEEIPLATAIAQSFAKSTELPAYEYRPDHPYSVRIDQYLFARNLLANRLYLCPVIFLEPYTMNSTEFIERHKAGDYEGFKMVDGKMRLSVYREYAQAVADGITSYYSSE
ncbi:MAG: N-acetylmuramoyl-L-alanine amidase [Akkermansiaceae bacterium]